MNADQLLHLIEESAEESRAVTVVGVPERLKAEIEDGTYLSVVCGPDCVSGAIYGRPWVLLCDSVSQ